MSDYNFNLDFINMFAPMPLPLPLPSPPAHRYRACPSLDRPEFMLYRWSEPAAGVPGGWVPDSAALLGNRSGTLRLYRLNDADDAIVALATTNGRIFIYPQMSFAERADILLVPSDLWISNDSARPIWSDELDSVVAADSGGPPPQPPGAGAAAAAGGEIQPAQVQTPSVALSALVAAVELDWPSLQPAAEAGALPPQHHHHHHHLWNPAGNLALDWSAVAAPILVEPSLAALSLLLEAAAAATARPEPSAPPAPLTMTLPLPLPKHIATIVLERASADGTLCPITMEPITPATGIVSSCGHVFQAAALKEWFLRNGGDGHATCPECRQPCAV